MTISFASDTPDGCTLHVRIHPGARKNAISGMHDSSLKISFTSPPVDGRANEALIHFLAKSLCLPKARITLLAGQTSQIKLVRVTGKSAAQVQTALSPSISC